MSQTPTRAQAATPVHPGVALPGFGRWSDRSEAEQVRLYTTWSLYSVAWFLLAMGLLGAAARLGETGPAAVLAACVVLVGVAVTRVMRTMLAQSRQLEVGEHRAELATTAVVTAGLTGWAATLPAEASVAMVFIAVGTIGWACGGYRDRRVQWVAIGLSAVLGYLATSQVFIAAYGAAIAAFFGFTVVSSLWLLRIVTELDRARGTQAALAVAEERLRFSRDVHDVLGRSLSTIAVQAELAATLARRGDERTGERILQVRSTAHDALREARELARGYRPLDLDHELDGAASLLRSAGIAAHTDLDGLPEAWHEPVARVVREAVTNVLRHSSATSVRITYADQVVEVLDDGARPETSSGDGSGLAGLREDLAPLGARLDADFVEGGFRVRLRLDGAAPSGALGPLPLEQPASGATT